MPRIISGMTPIKPSGEFSDLLEALVHELRSKNDSGQPVIHEYHFAKTGKMKATVLWDRWEHVPFEERADLIRRAYLKVESESFVENLALLVGLTFPEAHEAGMLPYQITPLIRKVDPVTLQQCHKTMVLEGASLLFPGGKPELRFATQAEAESARTRLIRQLPGSEPVWTILEEVGLVRTAGEL